MCLFPYHLINFACIFTLTNNASYYDNALQISTSENMKILLSVIFIYDYVKCSI